MRRLEAANANALLQTEQLAAENQQLRAAAGDARPHGDPLHRGRGALRHPRSFSRKLVLDKGLQHGVIAGQPVIDAGGVVGQITRVFPLSSEVTLVTDRNDRRCRSRSARTGERSVAFGGSPPGTIELRYLRTNADVRDGDLLVTSGLDGLFPPGLPVGTVSKVETGSSAFVHVSAQPAARAERSQAAADPAGRAAVAAGAAAGRGARDRVARAPSRELTSCRCDRTTCCCRPTAPSSRSPLPRRSC